MAVQRINTPDEARALADHLLAAGRRRPVCLVSVAEGEFTPYIDLDAVMAELGEGFDYVVIPTGPLTFLMDDLLPTGANAFAGAARVYPVEDGWQKDPFAYPLVLCKTRADGPAATTRLIRDGQRLGTSRVTSPPKQARQVTAAVRMLVPPSRALAQTDGDDQVVIDSAQVLKGLGIAQLVRVGQEVEGLVGSDRQLVVTLSLDVKALDRYAEGSVVLGRVAEVHADRALVELVPQVRAVLMREDVTGNHVDRLSSLLATGDVVAGRVVRVGRPGGRPWKLRMSDVDDDEPVLGAPALLPGGPPWLTEDMVSGVGVVEPESPERDPRSRPAPGPPRPDPSHELAPSATAPAQRQLPSSEAPGPGLPPVNPSPSDPARTAPERVVTPTPAAAPDHGLGLRVVELETFVGRLQRAVATLERGQESLIRQLAARPEQDQGAHFLSELTRRERDEARSQVVQLQDHVRRVEADRDRLREELSGARKELGRAAKRAQRRGAGPDGPFFLDEEEELRERVRRTWVEQVPAAEKPALPLGEYVVLPAFLESLHQTPGVDPAKVAEVVVAIATGRVHGVAGYQTHQMRESDASERFRTREDGATCWRVSLQVKSPSARRLHFWQPPGGRPPELSSVRLHDDLRP